MSHFEKLIDHFQRYYYSQLLMFVVELIALVIAILYVRKDKIGRFFIFYIGFDFCILIIDIYLRSDPKMSWKSFNHFANFTNPLIGLTELLVYYYFFSKIIFNTKVKYLMNLFAILYSITVILFTATGFNFLSTRFNYIAKLIEVIEFLFLIPPCCIFFYEILNANTKLTLFERPSFWIVTGIFFFSIISIPYYLIGQYFIINNHELRHILPAALYYVPFTLNFVFLIKAFLCKKTLTT